MSSDDQGVPPTVPMDAEATRAAACASVRQSGVGVSQDLMTVYENLVPMIRAHCAEMDSASNPVLFAFIDTSAPLGTTLTTEVPTAIARELWRQGLPALHDVLGAALDPARRLDAVPRLGLRPGDCPDLAVLVYQYWASPEVVEGRLQKTESCQPRTGVPHVLQVELRAHGYAPLVAKWKVLPRREGFCVVPVAPRHFGRAEEPLGSMAASSPTAEPRVPREPLACRSETADEELATMQLPTFLVQSPSLRDWSDVVYLNDPVLVRYRAEDSQVPKAAPFATGFVTLDVVNELVVPTFYGDNEARQEDFLIRGTTMWVYDRERPIYKIVVIQPLKVAPSGP